MTLSDTQEYLTTIKMITVVNKIFRQNFIKSDRTNPNINNKRQVYVSSPDLK